jgi:transcriptional regulator with XRE-family HTH domain
VHTDVCHPFDDDPATADLPAFGRRLRRLRRLRGLKQGVVADLAGVTQTTVTRWERGEIRPQPQVARRLLQKLSGPFDGIADSALKRLVETTSLAAHLVADADHALLAASPSREREWRTTVSHLGRRSLWRYATDAICAAEQSLGSRGWWDDPVPAPVEVLTEAGDRGLPIVSGRLLWERVYLADGTPARLCTSLD